LVVDPCRRFSPEERSLGTSPTKLMNASALAKRSKSPTSAASPSAVSVSIPRRQRSREYRVPGINGKIACHGINERPGAAGGPQGCPQDGREGVRGVSRRCTYKKRVTIRTARRTGREEGEGSGEREVWRQLCPEGLEEEHDGPHLLAASLRPEGRCFLDVARGAALQV